MTTRVGYYIQTCSKQITYRIEGAWSSILIRIPVLTAITMLLMALCSPVHALNDKVGFDIERSWVATVVDYCAPNNGDGVLDYVYGSSAQAASNAAMAFMNNSLVCAYHPPAEGPFCGPGVLDTVGFAPVSGTDYYYWGATGYQTGAKYVRNGDLGFILVCDAGIRGSISVGNFLGLNSYNRTCKPNSVIDTNQTGCRCNVGFFTENEKCVPIKPVDTNSCQRSDSGFSTGFPIIPATGEKQLYETDYTDTGSHPLSIQRTYRSQLLGNQANLGNAWLYSPGASLVVTAGSVTVTITLGSGNVRTFSRVSSAGGATQTGVWTSGTVDTDQLNENIGGFAYRSASDDSVYQFDTNGKLQTQTQRNGWIMTYTYNGANQLSQIRNQFGRSLQLAYNPGGQLSQVTTPDNMIIGYEYDSNARLSVVRYPGTVSKTYLYEDASHTFALTGVVDENNARLATYSYESTGRAIDTQHAAGANHFQISYPLTSDSPAQITDPLGTARYYNYRLSSNQLAVTSADKPAATSGNDAASRVQNAQGLIDSSTDFAGFITKTTWDTARRLPTSTTRAAGRPEAQTTSTVWHPSFRLPVQITEQGKTTAFTYDAVGNKLSQTETDTTGGPSNGQGRTWAWAYNATPPFTGLAATSTDPRGKVTSYTYDSAGNMASSANPLGHVSSYLYDGAGRVTRATEPNGLQTTMAYDLRGRQTQTVRGSNLAAALQQKTSYTYTLPGQVASATMPNGYQVTYSYDAAQRLTGALDSRGNRISYTLDGMGNRTREEVKDASGTIALATIRVINSLNRVSAIQGSAGQTTQIGFDANAEPVQSTDPLLQTTRQTLDALRRPVSTQLPDGNVATTSYNQLNQITQAVDPKAVATVYVKNAWGEVLRETSPDSGSTSTTRDASGNVLTSTDARGNTSLYQYDNAGRISQVTQADGKLQLFVYDSSGAATTTGTQTGTLRQVQDPSGTTTYERDPFGRITKKTQVVLDNPTAPTSLITQYSYTQAGDLASIRYPSGLLVSYSRNASGQITGLQTKAGTAASVPTYNFITGITYSALQQPLAWQWTGMGSTNTAAISSASRSFDADGRMSANQLASYTYDAASRITSITQNLLAQRTVVIGTVATTQNYTTPVTWQVGYDNRDRVTSFTRVDAGNSSGEAASYTYDPNSNRLSAISQTTTDTNKDGLFGLNEIRKNTAQALTIGTGSNQLLGYTQVLTSVTGTKTNSTVNSAVNYSLDAAGKLTGDGLRSFAYDSTNRLSTVTLGSTFVGTDTIAGNELASHSYLHNAWGQRVFKSEPRTTLNPPNSATLSPDFVTWLKNNFSWLWATAQTNATLGDSYLYGEASAGLPSWALLGEYGNGGLSSTGRTEYIWLPTEDGSAIPVGMYRAAKFYAIHTDHLGTPRLMTDNTNQPVWQWAYSAFGDNAPSGILKPTTAAGSAYLSLPPTTGSGTTTATLLAQSAPGQVFNFRFPGQYSDSETGLFYNYFRNYRPGMGSYDQMDPIGLAGGWNRRGYVGGNPLSYTDPMGLQSVGPRGIPMPGPAPGAGAGSRGGYDPRTDTYTPSSPGLTLPKWLTPKSALDRCEAACEAQYDRDMDECRSYSAMTGEKYTFVACKRSAERRLSQCTVDCAKDCK